VSESLRDFINKSHEKVLRVVSKEYKVRNNFNEATNSSNSSYVSAA
jgi:hypothetical protein